MCGSLAGGGGAPGIGGGTTFADALPLRGNRLDELEFMRRCPRRIRSSRNCCNRSWRSCGKDCDGWGALKYWYSMP